RAGKYPEPWGSGHGVRVALFWKRGVQGRGIVLLAEQRAVNIKYVVPMTTRGYHVYLLSVRRGEPKSASTGINVPTPDELPTAIINLYSSRRRVRHDKKAVCRDHHPIDFADWPFE